ncbi:MAG: aldehyde ferredoxin oxidoreductase family protein [Dehalococcoidales bacterium]|nr:aldehyde ferredoxin oxidoreductase family protein [Dehalococcoidales bacterium]
MTENTARDGESPLYGYTGNLLRVNLSTGDITTEKIGETVRRRYLGGSGFVSYYLWKELKAGIDPLGSENRLVIATGPVTGASIMGSGRHTLGAKSPLTGTIALSQVGEFWGAELKRAGFDAVIIEGKAERPAYLTIRDGGAELHDASHLWGMETRETQNAIRAELGEPKARLLLIGPGGEKLVRYACIMGGLFDAAGRGGLGAVMGSKLLKAIAVRGSAPVTTADPSRLREIHKNLVANINKIPILKGWHEAGTGFDMDSGVLTGDVPVRNWRDGDFPAVKNITAITLRDTIGAGMDGCFYCPLRCKKKAKFDTPYPVDPAYGAPEYETLAALGSNLGIADLKAIVKANEMCNAAGIDTISAGGVIAFSMECYERGLLSSKDTDGLALTWGNAEAMLECIRKIVRREGFGDILARGIRYMAQRVGRGAEEFAMHVKGLDPGQHEPRLMPSMGLGFMVNPHGADHCLNVHDTRFAHEGGMRSLAALGFHEPVPMEDIGPRKVALFRVEYLRQALLDCFALCHLSSAPVDLALLAEILNCVTGWQTGTMELVRIAERVMTVARLFNIREGFTDEDDRLPPRYFQPKTSGALADRALDPEKMEKAKRYFYTLMGWDSHGVPLPERIEELYIE